MPVIRVARLSHAFAGGRVALTDITFDIREGETVALVGPNGAGKSTLLMRLCGVLPGTPGQASVCGLDPAVPADRAKLPAAVGVVFQNPDDQLFSPTLLDDAAFGPLNLGATAADARKLAAEALARVGLGGCESRAPHTLSGGEKRRAAVATVLAMAPRVLLLDEPTAFLDARGRAELVELLRSLPGTKLIATHDPDLVRDLCGRAIVMEAGRAAG